MDNNEAPRPQVAQSLSDEAELDRQIEALLAEERIQKKRQRLRMLYERKEKGESLIDNDGDDDGSPAKKSKSLSYSKITLTNPYIQWRAGVDRPPHLDRSYRGAARRKEEGFSQRTK